MTTLWGVECTCELDKGAFVHFQNEDSIDKLCWHFTHPQAHSITIKTKQNKTTADSSSRPAAVGRGIFDVYDHCFSIWALWGKNGGIWVPVKHFQESCRTHVKRCVKLFIFFFFFFLKELKKSLYFWFWVLGSGLRLVFFAKCSESVD